MKRFKVCSLFFFVSFSFGIELSVKNSNEEEAKQFLEEYDVEFGKLLNEATIASWSYETNITDENAQTSQDAWLKLAIFNAEAFENSTQFDATDFSYDTKRQLSKVSLYISSSKIQGKTSDHYMNRVVFLMEGSDVLPD